MLHQKTKVKCFYWKK